VDPVMVSTSGGRLLTKGGVRALVEELIPICTLVTPNIDEAKILGGMNISGIDGMEKAAEVIQGLGPGAVLIKGGHLGGEPLDVLYDGNNFLHIKGNRVPGGPFHGTGCVLSAAVAAYLASGVNLAAAVRKARRFLAGLMRKSSKTGRGDVPLV